MEATVRIYCSIDATYTYRWKPKLNGIDYVVELLTANFGVLVRVEWV